MTFIIDYVILELIFLFSLLSANVLILNVYLDNAVKIASLGGIEAVIMAMSIHKDISDVQENACRTLLSLAQYDGTIQAPE